MLSETSVGYAEPLYVSTVLQTLEYFSLDGINKWAYVGYESLFFVAFFFAAWAALQFVRWDKR